MDHEACNGLGHKSKTKIPPDFNKIKVHFVYDVKYDRRHKVRLEADGHCTNVPLSSTCSVVVSLKVIMLVLFLEEINGLKSWVICTGNGYLESKKK